MWSPDGTKMAAIYEGVLSVWPVAASGEPLGPPRRVTSESAHAPSWQGDSRHILYQSLDQLRIVDIETGETKTVPFNLTWTPAIPKTRVVVHAGKLLDMKSPTLRSNVDVIVTGNKITSVVPHAAANHLKAEVVDASDLTVMPGLTEFHSHLQKDYGAAQGRAWLAFGITTVRSPGNTPYEAVEDREANEAGVRPGPRVYGTGYLMEWNRVYYKMGIAISNVSQFEMELQRAKVLEHDLIKSYVRLPDLQQKRMVEFAHSIGVPVATHEIFPAAMVGVDNTEHTAATSRRGYSPKQATLQTAYEDVVQLFGKSQRIFCPMISGGGSRELFEKDPALKQDPRFQLYPQWIQRQVAAQPVASQAGGGGDPRGGSGKMVLDIMKAGGLVVSRHRHAECDQPPRRADGLHDGGDVDVRCAEGGDRQSGEGARLRRRHDRARQAGGSDRDRWRSDRQHREHLQGEESRRQRPRLRRGRTGRAQAIRRAYRFACFGLLATFAYRWLSVPRASWADGCAVGLCGRPHSGALFAGGRTPDALFATGDSS